MNTTPADLLERAAEILERDGWCQGWLTDAEGRVCTFQALADAEEELSPAAGTFSNAYISLHRFVAPSVLGGIPAWNDEEGRTEYEVIDAMRRTAKELRNLADPS